MGRLRALVAASGRGTRAGLPYPKTLFPIQGKPILVRIAELVAPFDNMPTITVSPEGAGPIRRCLSEHAIAAQIVIQDEPCGMGDAVLRFNQSSAFDDAEHVLLIWGDIPFIQPTTVAALVANHAAENNDFTFATRQTPLAYTVVSRDLTGRVTRVVETREEGIEQRAGERDIGLFVFRKTLVLDILAEELPGKWGRCTGEHGFLYIISHLVARGLKVVALPIATELDLVSLNSMNDINAYL